MSGPRNRRSALYLPASNPRAIDKAQSLDCDVIILDLEDAVAPEAKGEARRRAVEAASSRRFGSRELVIRINALDTPWGADDLAAVAAADWAAVLVPKVCSAADIAPVHDAVGSRPVWAMIETARALFRLDDIACADGVGALVFGGNDLAKELGVRVNLARAAFAPTLVQIVAAAKAFGRSALDGVYNSIDDLDGCERECAHAAGLGFDGKTLIHPKQIEPCHRGFAPTQEELEWAEAVRDAFARPENADKGVIRLAGRMVERLHLEQALALLARSHPASSGATIEQD